MKRLFVFAFVALLGISMAQAMTVSTFMSKYTALVEKVEALDSNDYDADEVEQLKAEYKDLTSEVNNLKKKMSNEQLKKYYKLKARYQKKMTTIKAKRSYSSAKGWVKGIMGSDD